MQKGPKISRSADNTKDEGSLKVDSDAGSENAAHTSVEHGAEGDWECGRTRDV